MFCQTRANNRATRSWSSTKKKGAKAGAALKRLQEPANPGRSGVSVSSRSRSLSPGSTASESLKSPRGRGRPVTKKVTASSQKRDTSRESVTTSRRGASKSLPRKQIRVESQTDSGRKSSRRGDQSPEGGVGASPRLRGQPKKGVEGQGEKAVPSPRAGAGKRSPKVTLRSRLKKETPVSELSPSDEDSEPTRKGRNAVSPSAPRGRSSRRISSPRKKLPLGKQDIGKGASQKPESEGIVTRRKSLAKDAVETEENLKKETVKSQMKGVSVSDAKCVSADDNPTAKRGRGRPKRSVASTNQKGKTRVVSSKVNTRKTHLAKARKLAAKARQVKRGILRKVPKTVDESEDSDEEVDELLAEPSVFTKLKQDVPQQKSMKVEIGSVKELKKPGRRRAVEPSVEGVLQGRVEKRRAKKPGVTRVTRKKATSRELAALSVDPGSKLAERKQNAGGRLRSLSSGQGLSLMVSKKARRGRGGKVGARVRSPGSELGSDTTSLTSRGMSPSSDTDTDSKKRLRKNSHAARLRCPFLATRKRRSYCVRGPQGKFAKKPIQDSEAETSDQTLLEKNQKFSATIKRGRSGRRRGRGELSSRLDPKHSRAIDSSLSEATSATDTEEENELSKQVKRTETSSMKALPTDIRNVSNVKRSVKSNPPSISPLKRAEAAESKLSPSAQSVVTKSFSLKTIEKFKKAFKLVEPIGRSSSKDSVGSKESGGVETNTPDSKGKTGKEIIPAVKTKEVPANKKSKDLKSGRTSGNMVAVDQKPLTGAPTPALENTALETVTVDKVIPESKEHINYVGMFSETSAMPLDSDTSFKLELSTDSSSMEDLSVQIVDGAAGEKVKEETDTIVKAVTGAEVNRESITHEGCTGKAEERREDEPMEITDHVKDISSPRHVGAEMEIIFKSKTVADTKTVTAESKTVVMDTETVFAELGTAAPDSEAVIVEPAAVVPESKTAIKESKTVVQELKILVAETKSAIGESKTVVQESKTAISEPEMLAVDSDTVVAEATALVADLTALVAEATVAEELKAVAAVTKSTNGIPLAEGIESKTVVLDSKGVVRETPVVETKPTIAEAKSADGESKDEALVTKPAVVEAETLHVETAGVSEPEIVSSETKSEDTETSVAVSVASVGAGGGSDQDGEMVPEKEADTAAAELVPEKALVKADDVQDLNGTGPVIVSMDDISSKEKVDILSSGGENESDNAKTVESTAAIVLKESAAQDAHDKIIKNDMEIVEDAIAKVVEETVQAIVHGVEEKVESAAKEVVGMDQEKKGLEKPSVPKEQKASTGHVGDSSSGEYATSRKGPIILKIKTSALWKVDADGSSTSTGSGETEETLEDTPIVDGVVVSSSQEVLEASAMSRKVKDALEEVNKTLNVVATQEVVKEDTVETAAAAVTSAGPSEKQVEAKEEEAVTSTAEHLQDVEKAGKHGVGDECLAVVSSKEDGVSCSCHPSGKQAQQPAEPEAAPVAVAAAAEPGNVEEGAQAPIEPAAPPPKLATASMVEVERRIEEIQAMVSDIQKQIKTGTGTSKVVPGIRSLDTEYPYGPRNIHRPDEKGDLKLTIKLGGKKGDATAAFSAGETSGVEKKGGKKHVEEPKTYPKRHISPKYSELPWVEYSESYFEDMARKQKKSLTKLEGKQETQIGEARPKRKPVRKTEYELYMYELKNPKRRKHKSGPTSMAPGSSTITASLSSECLIDHVDASTDENKPSNIPELLKLCKPCKVVLEDFVINLNLSALKRKQSAEGQEIHLAKRPRLNVGGGIYSKAEIDAQAIVKQLTPEKRRRSSGSRSGRRASGSSSTGSLASELESGRLSPSSPRALDVPASRLSPKPHKRKVNRTGFPRQPKKYYYVYQCKFCPYSTNYRIAMDDHVYTHLDVVPFRCGYCNSVFGAKSGAVMHHKRNHQNLALRCIKSVDVDESQYYNYVYVTGGRHKTPAGARPASPSRAGGKEARNVFESIMKEIPTSGADALPHQSTAPVPVAAVAPMASAPPRIQTSHPVIPGQKIMPPAQLPTQAKPPVLAQAKPGPSPASPVKPAQTLSKSPHSDKLPVYQCKFCKFSTDLRHVIETHLQHYHEEEYRFICPLCDLAFCKREETMVKHFKKWHPGRNVMFKRAPGYKDREVATSDVAISYQTAAQKSLRPDLNDAQVSNHERLLAATSAPILPAPSGSATPSNMAAPNVSTSSSPLIQFHKQQVLGNPQSSSPGPDLARKSNKPSITDIAANLASKVGGIPSDTAKSSNQIFLNIPDVRSRGSSPNAPDRNQAAAAASVGQKLDRDVSRAPVSGGKTGILDLSRSSRESTPVPPGSNDLPPAQDDVSNLKIVNVVSLSTQGSAAVFPPPEMEEVQSLVFCCRNCKTENSSLDEIIKHIEAAHAQMDFWFACPYCPYGCSKHRGNMVRHIRRAHPDKEASEVDIHLIDEAKYISKRSVTMRQPRSQNVPVIASTGQPVQMQQFSSPGSMQMTQMAPTRGAPPLIPMARAAGNQQRTLPPPLIRAVAMTSAISLPVASSSSSQSMMRPASGHPMSGTPPSRMQTLPGQTGFPPPNAQVFQGVPHRGVTHVSQPVRGIGARLPINPRMAAIPSQAPKQNVENKTTTEHEKFSVFNLRPTNPSVFPQASRLVVPTQAGAPMQYGHPGMAPQQIPFSAAPPVRGQNPGQVPYRPPQPPTS